jgi:putative tryptophan/tyrosine transport system substrate-binding protein
VRYALCALLLALCASADAQQLTKLPRIGFLSAATSTAAADRTAAIRHGLRELGYIEGQNITIEWRYAEGKFDRIAALTAELVRLKVDVIISTRPLTTRAAKEATTSIPIVMTRLARVVEGDYSQTQPCGDPRRGSDPR